MFNSKEYIIDRIISEAIVRKLNESKGIKSRKIYDAISAHGGIAKDDSMHKVCDLHNLTDDDFVCVMPNTKVEELSRGHDVDHWRWVDNWGLDVWAKNNGVNVSPGDRVEAIKLADGVNSLIIIIRNESLYKDRVDGWKRYFDKRQKREANHPWTDGKNRYYWKNKEAEDIFKNPYFKQWPREAQVAKLNNAREFSDRMVQEAIEDKIQQAREYTNTEATEKQKNAGNYRKGTVWINGFEIKIENPKGSYRKGKDRNGKEWKTLMKNDYGYFTRTVGKDGDAIDVFIGPNYESEKIYCIDQKIGGKFDETKVMFCFHDMESAKKAYLANYNKDWKGFWKITEVTVDQFKKWLYDGHRQRKPFFQYVEFEGCEKG